MRIGIITFWQSDDNYGQLLQCYALQRYLTDMGHDAFLIKFLFSNETSKISYTKKLRKLIKIYPLYQYFLNTLERRINNKFAISIKEKNKRRSFQKFQNDNIKCTEQVFKNLQELRETPPQADCYITGSDQVWSMLLSNDNNKAYFLDFGNDNVKRISYAASFGRDSYPTELTHELQTQLEKFDAISVREESGVKICLDVGIQAVKVLDPTFLLLKSHYSQYLYKNTSDGDKYFYIYSINVKDKNELYWDEIYNYALKKSIKPKITASSGYFAGREVINDADYSYATVSEWLNYINNAEFIVTTSFHGIVFCLIQNKNFIYVPLKGHHSKGNNRVKSLLKSLDLESKICWNKKEVSKTIDYNINWNTVNDKIEQMRLESIQFLTMSLK